MTFRTKPGHREAEAVVEVETGFGVEGEVEVAAELRRLPAFDVDAPTMDDELRRKPAKE